MELNLRRTPALCQALPFMVPSHRRHVNSFYFEQGLVKRNSIKPTIMKHSVCLPSIVRRETLPATIPTASMTPTRSRPEHARPATSTAPTAQNARRPLTAPRRPPHQRPPWASPSTPRPGHSGPSSVPAGENPDGCSRASPRRPPPAPAPRSPRHHSHPPQSAQTGRASWAGALPPRRGPRPASRCRPPGRRPRRPRRRRRAGGTRPRGRI